MTVATTTNVAVLSANGTATVYPFPFRVLDATHLTVQYKDGDTDEVTHVYDPSEYTVVLNYTGGSVTFLSAPATGGSVIIQRMVPYTQDLDVVNQGGFYPQSVEDQLDEMVMQTQQVADAVGRALKVPIGETVTDLPVLASRAGNYLAFDNLGNPTAGASATQMAAYLAAFGSLADGSYTYRTKSDVIAALGSIPNNTFVRVLVDESKGSTLAIYQMVGGVLEYVFSLGGTSDARVPATGVLFDTDGVDNFTDLLYTTNAALTVTSSQVAFSSGSPLDLIMSIPAKAGGPFYHAYDHWEIDATFAVTSYPAAGVDAVRVGSRYYVPATTDGVFGMLLAAHGASSTTTLVAAITSDTVLEYTANSAGLPKTFRVRYNHDYPNQLVTHTVNINGGADTVLTEPYAAGSHAGPNHVMSVILRFLQGVMTCTKLKFSASYPNAHYACIGDSLTLSASASPITNGFAHLLRTAHPGQVLIDAGSGSTTGDWVTAIESATRMAPQDAFVLLGVNDFVGGVTDATMKANYTSIINSLIVADIIPVVLTVPPINNGNVPAFNTWLKAQGWRYIDIYPILLGSGVSLHPGYDSGDGIHWNNAGHTAVYNAVAAYIASNGL